MYFKLETKAKNVKVKNLLNPFMFSAEEAYQNNILLCAKEHILQQQNKTKWHSFIFGSVKNRVFMH